MTIIASRSNGGSTWIMPPLMLQGPNPFRSMRRFTAGKCAPKIAQLGHGERGTKELRAFFANRQFFGSHNRSTISRSISSGGNLTARSLGRDFPRLR